MMMVNMRQGAGVGVGAGAVKVEPEGEGREEKFCLESFYTELN